MSIAKGQGNGASFSRKERQADNKFFFRLASSYHSFFQAMAEDYYKRGKIKAPSISLLAKTCLLTTGNAWNRMQIQLMNKEWEWEWKLRQVEQERQRQQQ